MRLGATVMMPLPPASLTVNEDAPRFRIIVASPGLAARASGIVITKPPLVGVTSINLAVMSSTSPLFHGQNSVRLAVSEIARYDAYAGDAGSPPNGFTKGIS